MRLANARDKSCDVNIPQTAQLEGSNKVIEKRDETILLLSQDNDNY